MSHSLEFIESLRISDVKLVGFRSTKGSKMTSTTDLLPEVVNNSADVGTLAAVKYKVRFW